MKEICIQKEETYHKQISTPSTNDGIETQDTRNPDIQQLAIEKGCSKKDINSCLSRDKIHKDVSSNTLLCNVLLPSGDGKVLTSEAEVNHQIFYSQVLRYNDNFTTKFPEKAKISTRDLTCITEYAGTHLISQNQRMQKDINLFFESIEQTILSLDIVKYLKFQGIMKEAHFVTRLIQRAKFCFTSDFIYRIKGAFELYSSTSNVKVFQSCEDALESGFEFMKTFWRDTISKYRMVLKDAKHMNMIYQDSKKGILNHHSKNPGFSSPEYYIYLLDSFAFYRYQRTYSHGSWHIFAIWLQKHAPEWYALDFQVANCKQIPDISKPMKERLNVMVREKVQSFQKRFCIFEFEKGEFLKWRIRSSCNVIKSP